MKNIKFTNIEIAKLKALIKELNEYYPDDESDDSFVWDFEDVDNQRQIAVEFAKILTNRV